MKLRTYIVRRLLLLIPVLVGVSIITFALTRLVGDPAAIYIDERCSLNPACVQGVNRQYGFDQPVPIQYVRYMEALFRGDLGYSRTAALPVSEAIARKFPATFELATASMILAVILGIPLGVVSATKRDKALDHATRIFALTGVSIPVFWLALMLKWTLYFKWFELFGVPLLPVTGRSDLGLLLYDVPGAPIPSRTYLYVLDSILAGSWQGFEDAVKHLVMPAVTLAFVTM